MSDDLMITTSDNPFDYFTEFDSWFAFDTQAGYHTLSYLARIARTSEDNSDADNQLAIDRAIDDILELNVTGNYIRVARSVAA